jgi:hypothetical protein
MTMLLEAALLGSPFFPLALPHRHLGLGFRTTRSPYQTKRVASRLGDPELSAGNDRKEK